VTSKSATHVVLRDATGAGASSTLSVSDVSNRLVIARRRRATVPGPRRPYHLRPPFSRTKLHGTASNRIEPHRTAQSKTYIATSHSHTCVPQFSIYKAPSSRSAEAALICSSTVMRCSSPSMHTRAHASSQSRSRNAEGTSRYPFCWAAPLRCAAMCRQCCRFSRTHVGHRWDLKLSKKLCHACSSITVPPTASPACTPRVLCA